MPPPSSEMLIHQKYNYSVRPRRAFSDDGGDDTNDNNKWDELIKNREVFKNQPKRSKREAYMLCHLIRAVNDAAIYHKKHACSAEEANFNETWDIYVDPTDQ